MCFLDLVASINTNEGDGEAGDNEVEIAGGSVRRNDFIAEVIYRYCSLVNNFCVDITVNGNQMSSFK